MTGDEVRPVWVCAGRDVEADCLRSTSTPGPGPSPPPAPTTQTLLHCCFSTLRPLPSHGRRAHSAVVSLLSILPTNISITIP